MPIIYFEKWQDIGLCVFIFPLRSIKQLGWIFGPNNVLSYGVGKCNTPLSPPKNNKNIHFRRNLNENSSFVFCQVNQVWWRDSLAPEIEWTSYWLSGQFQNRSVSPDNKIYTMVVYKKRGDIWLFIILVPTVL